MVQPAALHPAQRQDQDRGQGQRGDQGTGLVADLPTVAADQDRDQGIDEEDVHERGLVSVVDVPDHETDTVAPGKCPKSGVPATQKTWRGHIYTVNSKCLELLYVPILQQCVLCKLKKLNTDIMFENSLKKFKCF